MILNDIYEEHLEEADFLREQHEIELAEEEPDTEYIEETLERMHAHLDGLVVGGAAAWQLLEPLLETGDTGEAFVAGAVALLGGDEARLEKLALAEEKAEEETKAGLQYARRLLVEFQPL